MSRLSPEQREKRRDLIFGSLLLAFSVVWTGTVYFTVPVGRGVGVGPQAFPLYLGASLIGLSALLLLNAWFAKGQAMDVPDDEEPDMVPIAGWPLARLIVSVCLVIMAYGYLMQSAGFVIATMLVVAFTLWVVVGVRRPVLVVGMSVGITAVSWLVFGQILGAYIPRGTWISLF
ncbi:tripartite tricarboxylate transporter TctB family protein [Alkalilacustris brevis]|uniref:tripartite tricarboxylate transporter TctB family protein n=1 Tax=Alkalilacustris brevis TaxID=2026338 RepID=UPI000E0DDD20|nr:tripartite tricarboxylate transporter TctB family protein [Alkalilacustris brevis]